MGRISRTDDPTQHVVGVGAFCRYLPEYVPVVEGELDTRHLAVNEEEELAGQPFNSTGPDPFDDF